VAAREGLRLVQHGLACRSALRSVWFPRTSVRRPCTRRWRATPTSAVFPRHACRARVPLRGRAVVLVPAPAPHAAGRALARRALTAAGRPAVAVAERWEEEQAAVRQVEQVRPVRRVDQVVNLVVRVLVPRRAIVAAWAG
jgi:hypothetical protein